MQKIIERLNEEVLICDGAMGTMLMSKGMPQGDCPDYWGIKKHKILFGIHKEYLDAGADITMALDMDFEASKECFFSGDTLDRSKTF